MERRTRTPASLFYKLRSRLDDQNNPLIKRVENLEDVNGLSSGEFVEFRALLRKNPLVELFETFREMMSFGLQVESAESGQAQQQEELQQALDQLQGMFGDLGMGTPNAGDPGQPDSGQQLAESDPNFRIISAFENALTKHGSLEVIGELLDVPGATAVVSTRLENFEGGDASQIIDGEFRVLGKIVRVLPSGSEGSINLLRKTPFGALKEEKFNELAETLNAQQEGEDEMPVELPDIRSKIEAPAILVLPMAIFV
jgi:hypothetical protein